MLLYTADNMNSSSALMQHCCSCG